MYIQCLKFSDSDHRVIKMIWKNKLFPSINSINGKTFPYASKGILRHYHHRYHPKLGLGIVSIRRIPCGCHACTAILSLFWDTKSKKQLISLDTEEFII